MRMVGEGAQRVALRHDWAVVCPRVVGLWPVAHSACAPHAWSVLCHCRHGLCAKAAYGCWSSPEGHRQGVQGADTGTAPFHAKGGTGAPPGAALNLAHYATGEG